MLSLSLMIACAIGPFSRQLRHPPAKGKDDCSWSHYGPYKGKIVDSETGLPIEGALVIAWWEHEKYYISPGGADGVWHLEKVFETESSADGTYVIPRFPRRITNTYISIPGIMAYKPGFIWTWSYSQAGKTIEEQWSVEPRNSLKQIEDHCLCQDQECIWAMKAISEQECRKLRIRNCIDLFHGIIGFWQNSDRDRIFTIIEKYRAKHGYPALIKSSPDSVLYPF